MCYCNCTSHFMYKDHKFDFLWYMYIRHSTAIPKITVFVVNFFFSNTEEFLISWTWEKGHFWNPSLRDLMDTPQTPRMKKKAARERYYFKSQWIRSRFKHLTVFFFLENTVVVINIRYQQCFLTVLANFSTHLHLLRKENGLYMFFLPCTNLKHF